MGGGESMLFAGGNEPFSVRSGIVVDNLEFVFWQVIGVNWIS